MFTNDKSALLQSLIFPVIIIIWGVARTVTDFLYAGGISAFTRLDALWRYVCFGAIICSVIAIIITLCGKVDTSRYFLKRLIGTCGLVVLYGVAMSFATSMLPAVFIGIAGIAYQILRVQDDDSSKAERAVLMLSDPAIHLTVFWGMQWISEFVKTVQ